jgi:hypothetical protein
MSYHKYISRTSILAAWLAHLVQQATLSKEARICTPDIHNLYGDQRVLIGRNAA